MKILNAPAYTPLNKKKYHNNSVSFGTTSNLSNTIIDEALNKELFNGAKDWYKSLFKFAGEKNGEAFNNVFNAIFTAISGAVIAYNPFSDRDEDTKKYTGMRQPISAVLAVFFSLGMTKPINDVIKRAANENWMRLDKYNLKLLQEKGYLESEIKRKNPNISKEELASQLEKMQKSQRQKVENALKEGLNSKRFFSSMPTVTTGGKEGKLSENDFRNLLAKTVNEMIVIERIEAKKAKKKIKGKTALEELRDAVKDVGDWKKAKETDIKTAIGNFNKKVDNGDFIKEFVKRHAKSLHKNIEGNRAIVGAVATTAITIVSCTVLNWVYPRVMDRYFPKLSGKKEGE